MNELCWLMTFCFLCCINLGLSFACTSYQGTARLMFNSFGSSLWMMPFSKYCRSDSSYWKHFFEGRGEGHKSYHCDDMESQTNYSGWPTNIINIEVPSIRGTPLKPYTEILSWYQFTLVSATTVFIIAGADVYPSIPEVVEGTPSSKECGLPTQLSFSAREVSDGTFFKAIEDYDPDSKRLLYQLKK